MLKKLETYILDWRKRTKDRIVQAFGGRCAICGYNKSNYSLDLHHLNPNDKEFEISRVRAFKKSWFKIVPELRKCILVCSNCHGEIHDGVKTIPLDCNRFDERFSDYNFIEKLDWIDGNIKSCPVCQKKMIRKSKTCSLKCAAKLTKSFNWKEFDLVDLYQIKHLTISKISDIVGCSRASVIYQLKKLNIWDSKKQ